MPIKKHNRNRYPWNWEEISYHIIHRRALDRCEAILEDGSRCNAENHTIVNGKEIVLSVAHLDHMPEHSDDENNMKAMCQRCHNRHDREHRNQSIKKTYAIKHGEAEPEDAGLVYYNKAVISEPENLAADMAKSLKLLPQASETYMIDELKDTIRHLLTLIPSAEGTQYAILLKSMELKDELFSMMNLPNAELNTLAVQVKIKTLKQKQQVIEQMIQVTGMMGKSMAVIRDGGGVIGSGIVDPQPSGQATVTSLRGHGIRTAIKNKALRKEGLQ